MARIGLGGWIYEGSIIIGVDLARQVFQRRFAPLEGEIVFHKKCSRKQFLAFMAAHPARRMALKVCAMAHHWAHILAELGHDVRLLAQSSLSHSLSIRKNDVADAEVIVESTSRPTMRCVEVKSPKQQGLGMIFRLRDLPIRQRKQTINTLRGHLAEYGLVATMGRENIGRL